MRGYPRFNFDAFDAAEATLQGMGWEVLNPARMDRENGFDPDRDAHQMDQEFLIDVMRRNLAAVLESDAVALLPRWEQSPGATCEANLAVCVGMPLFQFPEMRQITLHPEANQVVFGSEAGEQDKDILLEALELTSGDRQASYGPPDQDFARTARMWSALKGVDFTATEVAMFMILLKLSRETHMRKRDNWTDLAGYARCGWICRQEEAKRPPKALTQGACCETTR